MLSFWGMVCLCLFAVPQEVAAVKYGSLYKGSAYNHTHQHALHHTGYGSYSGLAQKPTATMNSTSSWAGVATSQYALNANSATMAVVPISGFTTAASNIRGGVTTYDTSRNYKYGRMRREDHPEGDECEHCIDLTGPEGKPDGKCDICGCDMDNCTCADDPEGPGYCWCPIDSDVQVLLFMAILAGGYAAVKRYRLSKSAAKA